MKCLSCGFENKPEKKFCIECGTKPEKKFCIECGTKLEHKCPQCNAEIETYAKFCGDCGTKLTGSKAPDLSLLEEKIDKIQRYLLEGLTQKILAQKDRIEGERKQVTVMFCDLVGLHPCQRNLIRKRFIPSWIRFWRS